jgi:lipopolysaccharide biosynthesis protein
MFWAQAQALAPLLQMGLAFDDFDLEVGQTDQTLAHALERFIGYLALAQGHKIALIQNPLLLNHYP